MSGGGIINVESMGGGTGVTLYASPQVENITIVEAGIYQTHTLPSGAKSFELKSRGGKPFKIKFHATNTEYILVKGWYGKLDLDTTTELTYYISSAYDNDVIEILSWL